MATTTNFGWETPDDTDLVKDGAAAIRTALGGVDTSFVDLKGGTTGQVLSKATNTDLDFTWVAQDDSNAIQNAIVDAKGDLITATAADTPARLAVGNNGEQIVANSAASSGLSWQGTQAAGKNYLINGAMEVWQRGTSSTSTSVYLADRWYQSIEGATAATISQSTSVIPTDFRYSMKMQRTAGNTGTGGIGIGQSMETTTSIPLQSQTVVMSFWLKAGANFSAASGTVNTRIFTGTGTDQSMATAYGSWTGYAETSGTATATTTWTRYSVTATIPSGATQAGVRIFWTPVGTAGADDSLYITGIQMEIGSVATSFTRAGGTFQGELAACQRYYVRNNSGNTNFSFFGWGIGQNPNVLFSVNLPVTMRTTPTTVDFTNLGFARTGAITSITTLVHSNSSPSVAFLQSDGASTTDVIYRLIANNSSSAYVGVGAEL